MKWDLPVDMLSAMAIYDSKSKFGIKVSILVSFLTVVLMRTINSYASVYCGMVFSTNIKRSKIF